MNYYLSGRLATLITISEEHSKNGEISFENVYGHREPVNLRMLGILITCCVCGVLFYGYPCMKKEKVKLCRKNDGMRPINKGHTNLSNLQD